MLCAYSVGAIRAAYSSTGIAICPPVCRASLNCVATAGDTAATCSATPDCMRACASINTCCTGPDSAACAMNCWNVSGSRATSLSACASLLRLSTKRAISACSASWRFLSARFTTASTPLTKEVCPPTPIKVATSVWTAASGRASRYEENGFSGFSVAHSLRSPRIVAACSPGTSDTACLPRVLRNDAPALISFISQLTGIFSVTYSIPACVNP